MCHGAGGIAGHVRFGARTATAPVREPTPEPAARSGIGGAGSNDGCPGETGRGRSADTPSEILIAGWQDIILGVYRRISENRIPANPRRGHFLRASRIFLGIAAFISIDGLVLSNTVRAAASCFSPVLRLMVRPGRSSA